MVPIGALVGVSVGSQLAGGLAERSQIPSVMNSSKPEVLAKTLGTPSRAHPSPKDTIPTTTPEGVSMGPILQSDGVSKLHHRTFNTVVVPPLSPWHVSLPVAHWQI